VPERLPPEDPREWLNRARSNVLLAQAQREGIYLEDLCFNAQQAVEKAIKAVLMQRAVEFPYVHDIHPAVDPPGTGWPGNPTRYQTGRETHTVRSVHAIPRRGASHQVGGIHGSRACRGRSHPLGGKPASEASRAEPAVALHSGIDQRHTQPSRHHRFTVHPSAEHGYALPDRAINGKRAAMRDWKCIFAMFHRQNPPYTA